MSSRRIKVGYIKNCTVFNSNNYYILLETRFLKSKGSFDLANRKIEQKDTELFKVELCQINKSK